MLEKLFAAKLRDLAPASALDQENVLQEIVQHVILASLAKTDFFSRAAFQGGTCLRVLNGLNRFSEDLDFILKRPDASFQWQPFLDVVRADGDALGIPFEIQGKSEAATAVRKAFLKTNAVGTTLAIALPFPRRPRKLRVKLEVDTNPPAGSEFVPAYITFPTAAALTAQTLESSFALKIHALLCRDYVKGRDWFDFIWYVSRRVRPNLALLANALAQTGPWQGKSQSLNVKSVNADWVREQISKKIRKLDWAAARNDVARFLPLSEQPALALWGAPFFLDVASRLAG